MARLREESHVLDIGGERERVLVETSDEVFDRFAFANRALDLVRPTRTRVAVCHGIGRVRVESGRDWRDRSGGRWAVLSIPDGASRRAIALAVAELAAVDAHAPGPYTLDVLFA